MGPSPDLLAEPDYTTDVIGQPEDTFLIVHRLLVAWNRRMECQTYETDVWNPVDAS